MSTPKKITYDQLNDAVHAAAAIIDEAIGRDCDRTALNAAISTFLVNSNIECCEEDDDDA